VTNPISNTRQDFLSDAVSTQTYEEDLEPYLTLFLKPLTSKKSEFSKQELQVMCKDPLHSPRLIRYLIEFVKEM
jgi:hypothetical protein